MEMENRLTEDATAVTGLSDQEGAITGEGKHYSTYFRMYDADFGRWWSRDPVTHPFQSPYSAFDNNPVLYIDPLGADSKVGDNKEGTGETWLDDDGNYYHLGDRSNADSKSEQNTVNSSSLSELPSLAQDVGAYNLSELAGAVYGGDGGIMGNAVRDTELEEELGLITDNAKSGYKAALYKKTLKSGKTVYIFSNAGTEDLTDGMTDLEMYLGTTKQHQFALDNARILINAIEKDKIYDIILTGHSLGGSLSSLMSRNTGIPSVVFNGAGYGESNFEENHNFSAESVVWNIVMVGEILNASGVSTNGNTIYVSAPIIRPSFLRPDKVMKESVRLHGIDLMQKVLLIKELTGEN